MNVSVRVSCTLVCVCVHVCVEVVGGHQMPPRYEVSRREVRAILRFPISLVGGVEDSKRVKIEARIFVGQISQLAANVFANDLLRHLRGAGGGWERERRWRGIHVGGAATGWEKS